MFGAQLLRAALTVASNIVVARLLLPKDYGIFAMAALISGFLLQFASLRVHLAVIQRREVTDAQLSTLFWLQLVWSVGLSAVCWAAGPLAAAWFDEAELATLLGILSLTLPLNAAYGWQLTVLRRELKFRAVALIDICSFALATVTVVVLAWRGFGYWALAGGMLAERIFGAIIAWVCVPWRPGLPRRGTGVRSFFAFGAHVTASGLLAFATRNVDNALIGWRWGATALGEYTRAYAVFISPLSQLFPPLHEVMVPLLSRAQDRERDLLQLFTLAVRLLAWLTMPLSAFILVAAEPLIVVLLGAPWRGAAPILQWLSLGGIVQAVHASLGWLYLARAHSREVMHFSAIAATVTVVSFLVGLPFGPVYVAASYSVVTWCLAAAYYFHARHVTRLDLRPLLHAMFWPLVACALLVPIGLTLRAALSSYPALAQTAALTALAGVVCGALLVVSGDGKRALSGARYLRQARTSLSR